MSDDELKALRKACLCDGLDQEFDALIARLEAAEQKQPHYPACNYWTKPIGLPGCICVVTCKSELKRLEAAEADSRRYRGLLSWLQAQNLLTAKFCKPVADVPCEDWWVLQTPAMINGSSCEGHGKTEDAAIDAAIASGEAAR